MRSTADPLAVVQESVAKQASFLLVAEMDVHTGLRADVGEELADDVSGLRVEVGAGDERGAGGAAGQVSRIEEPSELRRCSRRACREDTRNGETAGTEAETGHQRDQASLAAHGKRPAL